MTSANASEDASNEIPMSTDSASGSQGCCQIAVDIGGTFTDGILHRTDDGAIWLAKALTTPDDPGRAVSTVVEDLLRQARQDMAHAPPVSKVIHATTLVTNAVIERKGGRTALILTKGTADLLDIRREDRYELYDLDIAFPEPLVSRSRRIEVEERLTFDGGVRLSLTQSEIDRVLARLARLRVEAVAICLLHAYANDIHERALANAIRSRLPNLYVSLSSAVAKEIREYERMSTTSVNAYVQPVTAAYLNDLQGRLDRQGLEVPLQIMVSSGGFTSPVTAAQNPVRLLESGPAAGVLSAAMVGANAQGNKVLAFDMGGTTAKACVTVDGKPEITNLFEAGRMHRFKRGSGLPIMTPSIDLIEIGAGGGSIADVSDLGLLTVGPASAGSKPGPACYGQGGSRPTVTDADLLLGYLSPDYFLGGKMPLFATEAKKAIAALAGRLALGIDDVAFGIFDLVNENMAGAARVHIAEKGLDPRDFTIVATGGAGPVHAVEVAAKLGIMQVICPLAAGNGSCLGLLAAPSRADRSWSKVCLLAQVDWAAAQEVIDKLVDEAKAELVIAKADLDDIDWMLALEMRYEGQGDTIAVEFPLGPLASAVKPEAASRFQETYSRLYGRSLPQAPLEVVTWRLTGRSSAPSPKFKNASIGEAANPDAAEQRRIFFPETGTFEEAPVYNRYGLAVDVTLAAPLILQEPESTLVVARDADVQVLPDFSVRVTLA